MQREGTAVPSMTTAMMERIFKLEGPDIEEEEKIARNTAATAYGGQWHLPLSQTTTQHTCTLH